ncbi:hypothetical protein ABFU49_19805 [Xanthomonas campestris pv. campestris]|uniref:hypothetical protein n=1 Tax=Xanthomonas TaxID=338 RepID=UPI001A13FD1F|nr:hypothetical protein [Xanthomonas prunicola]MBF9171431.1 hypothetical protein [Xanthomonas campestris pv. campestris]MEB1591948.1 hypothetical protein [Xanthomonas campestris pv. campestris]MEB1722993.1 hypothetical protein [Xanthomonas campestris pv. campestris]MEB1849371.1 hypothetical protein [Xanthomonas campestris pv. campestris]UXA61882.1 hypothetical protein M0D48_02285 [Xanthomonas prunicola]
MKLKFFAAIAAGVVLCSCDGNGAPKISLDKKLTCGALIEARVINDAVTYGNIWKMPINAAARAYGTKTEVEAYFKNSVLADSRLVSDMHQKIYEQCVADSDKSMESAFREALNQSFEQNKNSPNAGMCAAFNEGRITIESVMALVIAREGKFNAQVDPRDPRIPIYQEKLKAQCAIDPTSRLTTHIESVTWELTKKEQEDRQQAMDQAKQAFIADTQTQAEKVISGVAIGRLPTCAQMARISSDGNSESRKLVDDVVALATDAALARLPIDQAAYTRWNIENSARGVGFDSCAESGGDMADAVAQYNWSKEEVGPWAEQNEHLMQQEAARRSREESGEVGRGHGI